MLCIPGFSQTGILSFDNSGNQVHWKLKPQVEAGSDSINIFRPGYNAGNWVEAIVPGIVFPSCFNAGLEKGPIFGDNIYKVDRAKYKKNFWCRMEFSVPENLTKERIWLNFRGINRRGRFI